MFPKNFACGERGDLIRLAGVVDHAQRHIRLHPGFRARLAQLQAHRQVILGYFVDPTREDAKLPRVPVNLGLRAARFVTHGVRQRREAVEALTEALDWADDD